jgi:hypothetical protein
MSATMPASTWTLASTSAARRVRSVIDTLFGAFGLKLPDNSAKREQNPHYSHHNGSVSNFFTF